MREKMTTALKLRLCPLPPRMVEPTLKSTNAWDQTTVAYVPGYANRFPRFSPSTLAGRKTEMIKCFSVHVRGKPPVMWISSRCLSQPQHRSAQSHNKLDVGCLQLPSHALLIRICICPSYKPQRSAELRLPAFLSWPKTDGPTRGNRAKCLLKGWQTGAQHNSETNVHGTRTCTAKEHHCTPTNRALY